MIRNKAVEANFSSNVRILRHSNKKNATPSNSKQNKLRRCKALLCGRDGRAAESKHAAQRRQTKNATLCSCRAVGKQPAGGCPNLSTFSLRPVLIVRPTVGLTMNNIGRQARTIATPPSDTGNLRFRMQVCKTLSDRTRWIA